LDNLNDLKDDYLGPDDYQVTYKSERTFFDGNSKRDELPSDEKLDYSPFETNRYDSIYTQNQQILRGLNSTNIKDNSNYSYDLNSNLNNNKNNENFIISKDENNRYKRNEREINFNKEFYDSQYSNTQIQSGHSYGNNERIDLADSKMN